MCLCGESGITVQTKENIKKEITPVISFLGLFFVMQAVALFTKDIRRFLNGFFLIEFNA